MAVDPRPGRALLTTAEMNAALVEDTEPTVEATQGERRVTETYIYTPDQDEALVEWFRDNPLFYDKSNIQYKNKQEAGMCL